MVTGRSIQPRVRGAFARALYLIMQLHGKDTKKVFSTLCWHFLLVSVQRCMSVNVNSLIKLPFARYAVSPLLSRSRGRHWHKKKNWHKIKPYLTVHYWDYRQSNADWCTMESNGRRISQTTATKKQTLSFRLWRSTANEKYPRLVLKPQHSKRETENDTFYY